MKETISKVKRQPSEGEKITEKKATDNLKNIRAKKKYIYIYIQAAPTAQFQKNK